MPRRIKRKVLVACAACAIVLLGGYAGFRAYSAWREKHLLSMARSFLAKSDLRNASLSLSELLRVNPRNIEANRLIAEDADALNAPAALTLRERVVELDPQSVNDRLALAQTAVRCHDLVVASNALAGIDGSAKSTAAFHNIAGTVAVASGQWAEAQAHFMEAGRLDPANLAARLSLAVLQLRGTNDIDADKARDVLNGLAANPTNAQVRAQARRELIVNGLRHNSASSVRGIATQLVAETNSPFTDQLLRLEVLRQAEDPEFEGNLDTLREKSAGDPDKVQQLGMWQVGKVPPENAVNWLRGLPQAVRTNEPVAVLIAEGCITLRDWKGLQACVDASHWGRMENVRHAFKARALREQGLDQASTGEWAQARESARDENSLVALLRLTTQWGWSSEGQEILHDLVNQYPGEKWAQQSLAQLLFASGQSLALMQLYDQEVSRTPSDVAAKGNLSLIALLVNAKELRPAEMAKELYQIAPTNPTVAAAYALSLHLLKKPAEAVKVMAALDPRDLENPSVAAYYGIFLQAAGNSSEAKRYLELGSKSPMLPEERKMMETAKAGQ